MTVDSGDSSTFKVVKKNAFHITYGDGSGADGDYFTDDFTIGEASINDLQMGIAHNANLTQGLLGIGYSLNEASNYDDPSTEENEAFVYPNLIDAMVSQHLISINAYSLYLDDLDSDSGSIIFGGLDTDKFHGDLVQMPIVPRTLRNGSELFIEFAVALTGVSLSDGSSNKAIPLSGSPPAVVLDSGTALTYLPTTLAESIYDEIGAYDDSSYFGTGLVFADCDLIETGKSFDFKFGGSDGSDSVTIKVPYSEMILFPEKLGFSLDGYIPSDVPFSHVCILGIMSSPEDPYIMGDTFLRSAYVVYDLKNNVIALAQTNFNSDDSNVVDFKAGQTAIPAVSGVASSAGVVETGTGKPGGKTDSEGSTTRRATPRPTSASASGSGSASSRTSSATITDSTATGSGNAGVATVPALDISGLVVLGGATLFAVLGGGWLLA